MIGEGDGETVVGVSEIDGYLPRDGRAPDGCAQDLFDFVGALLRSGVTSVKTTVPLVSRSAATATEALLDAIPPRIAPAGWTTGIGRSRGFRSRSTSRRHEPYFQSQFPSSHATAASNAQLDFL